MPIAQRPARRLMIALHLDFISTPRKELEHIAVPVMTPNITVYTARSHGAAQGGHSRDGAAAQRPSISPADAVPPFRRRRIPQDDKELLSPSSFAHIPPVIPPWMLSSR